MQSFTGGVGHGRSLLLTRHLYYYSCNPSISMIFQAESLIVHLEVLTTCCLFSRRSLLIAGTIEQHLYAFFATLMRCSDITDNAIPFSIIATGDTAVGICVIGGQLAQVQQLGAEVTSGGMCFLT